MGEALEGRPAGIFHQVRVEMIHLDTSFLIRGLVYGSAQDRALRKWLKDGERLGMSAVAWSELLCGPLADNQLKLAADLVSERLPFLEEDALVSGRLFNESGRRRGSLMDCMIAASALRAGEPLATANASDFRRFPDQGLVILEG